MYQSKFLKIKNIAGTFYEVPNRLTDNIAIFGIGVPRLPDNGTLDEAKTILNHDTDLFVPDYIGYGRSDGEFSPTNVINTFLTLYDCFKLGTQAKCSYLNLKKYLRYKNIYIIGRSFGASYALLLPKFNNEIKNICSIFPITNWSIVGKIPEEETVKNFYDAINKDGYKYLYRGILNKVWIKQFSGLDGLSPIENIKYLKNTKIFIGHGIKDKNINYNQSKDYFNKIQETFPDKKNQFVFKTYQSGHDSKTSIKAIKDYFKFIDLKGGEKHVTRK